MRELTVKQYAEREQVDPRTVRRWISKGAIPPENVRRNEGNQQLRIIDRRTTTDNLGQRDR